MEKNKLNLTWNEKIEFSIEDFSNEILFYIFGFLKVQDLMVCSQVCKSWRILIAEKDDNAIWSAKCNQRWQKKQKSVIQRILNEYHTSWKAKYEYAEKDSTRRSIKLDELSKISWRFTFNQFSSPEIYPIFTEDGFLRMGTFYSSSLGRTSQIYRWVFQNNNQSIQVAQFPPLTISRTLDWGWQLQNHFVSFYSIEREGVKFDYENELFEDHDHENEFEDEELEEFQ